LIHEIAPKRFDNHYDPAKKPSEDCFVMHFLGRRFLSKVEGDQISLPSYGDVISAGASGGDFTFLFSISGEDYFRLELDSELQLEGFGYNDINVYRSCFPMDRSFAAISAFHLNNWYESERFCGRCGAKLIKDDKERAMKCPSCGNIVYPRINPCVIVGVIHDGRILCTQYNRPNAGKFALIAGFAEIGESIEETVAREVMEEVGLKVRDLRFYRSEPWGMSSSLLHGFYCRVDGDPAVHVDGEELAAGRWWSREELEAEYKPSHVALTSEMIARFMRGEITEEIFG